MARPKKDSNLATVSYNLQNVERSIGYSTALINHGVEYRDILKTVIELYELSPLEAAIVQMGTVDLIASQFKVIVQNSEGIDPSFIADPKTETIENKPSASISPAPNKQSKVTDTKK